MEQLALKTTYETPINRSKKPMASFDAGPKDEDRLKSRTC
jgi:hypothetical protein